MHDDSRRVLLFDEPLRRVGAGDEPERIDVEELRKTDKHACARLGRGGGLGVAAATAAFPAAQRRLVDVEVLGDEHLCEGPVLTGRSDSCTKAHGPIVGSES